MESIINISNSNSWLGSIKSKRLSRHLLWSVRHYCAHFEHFAHFEMSQLRGFSYCLIQSPDPEVAPSNILILGFFSLFNLFPKFRSFNPIFFNCYNFLSNTRKVKFKLMLTSSLDNIHWIFCQLLWDR